MASKDIDDFSFLAGSGADADNDFVYLWDDDGSPNDKKMKLAELLKNIFIPPGALIAIIEDQKASGSHGGTFTSGSLQTRDLNQVVWTRQSGGADIITLSSNKFQFAIAGDFEIAWSAPAHKVNNHQSALYDATGTAVQAYGSSENCDDETAAESESLSIMTRSMGSVRVSVSANDEFEIQHECQASQSTDGFGRAGSFTSATEVYTRVEVRAAGFLPA